VRRAPAVGPAPEPAPAGGGTGGATSFCADYTQQCGNTWAEYNPQTTCAVFFDAAPPGITGEESGASQACYLYHLGLVPTMGDEHCGHAAGAPGGPCLGAAGEDGTFALFSTAAWPPCSL
jgi:hypothetical protein